MTARKKQLRGAFIALFLLVQVGIPILGLYASHLRREPVRFSWHMFSRVPTDAGD